MRALPFIVALAALAGCLGADTVSPAADAESIAPGVLDAVDAADGAVAALDVGAPLWSAGDAWAIQSKNGDETESAVLVVTRADADAYVIETTSPTLAGYDAMFDISYLGRIRASDLAGAQQDTPIQFFRFPLSDGLSWTTTWDGREVALTATAAPAIATPLGAQPGFLIVGLVDGEPYVEYDYVPALRWWSRLDFAEGYGFSVQRVAANWTGETMTAMAKTVYSAGRATAAGDPAAGRFTIDPDQTEAWLVISGSGDQYGRAVALVEPSGTPFMTKSAENADLTWSAKRFWQIEQIPATPGDWSIAAPMAHTPGGSYEIQIMELVMASRAFP